MLQGKLLVEARKLFSQLHILFKVFLYTVSGSRHYAVEKMKLSTRSLAEAENRPSLLLRSYFAMKFVLRKHHINKRLISFDLQIDKSFTQGCGHSSKHFINSHRHKPAFYAYTRCIPAPL